MNIKEIISQLNLVSENIETKEGFDAIESAIKVLSSFEHRYDEKFDFQGWKQNQITLGDIRRLVEKTKDVSEDVKVIVCEDDGMGYGGNNGVCTDIYYSDDADGKDIIKVWF